MKLSANSRTAAILFVTLCLAVGSQYRRSPVPPFNSRKFTVNYEVAFSGKDTTFYDAFFSRRFWVGNQFATRSEALDHLKNLFELHDNLSANLRIQAITLLADGRSFLMNARLTLRGRRLADGQMETIDEVTGSSLYVYEEGSWRMYKMVEKKLALAVGGD